MSAEKPRPWRARVTALARRPVVGDLAVTWSGRWVQLALALAGNVVSARALGPEAFGRFGLIIATITILGTLADAGLTYSAVKYIAQYAPTDPARAQAHARQYQRLRLLGGIAGAALGFGLAAPISTFVLGDGKLTPALQLACGTLGSLGLSSYPGTVLAALGQFGRMSLAGISNAVITVAGIGLLTLAGRLTLETLLAWNVVLPLLSTLPAWTLLPPLWRPWSLGRAGADDAAARRELLGFSRWMVVSNVGSIISTQSDLILLGRLSDATTVGVYSVALTLASRLDTLNQSLITVLMPRVSRLVGGAALVAWVQRVALGALALAAALAGLAGLAQPLIGLLYGERYTAAAGLFGVLMLVVLFDLITSSLFLIALPLDRPRLLAVGDWLRAGVVGAAGLLLIPAWGGYGAALARLASRVLGAVYTGWALRRALHASPPAVPDRSDPSAEA